jgi:ribonuclease P protein component
MPIWCRKYDTFTCRSDRTQTLLDYCFLLKYYSYGSISLMIKPTFRKSERLCHVKSIDGLFNRNNSENQSFLVYPLKAVYLKRQDAESSLPQILISVPKRRFKRAVDRNLLKRRIREAYRLNKEFLSDTPPKDIGFVYVANEILEFKQIERAMKKSLARFQ